jgi:hypothetical protein
MTKEEKRQLLASMTVTIVAAIAGGVTSQSVPAAASLVPNAFAKEILALVEHEVQ